MKDNSLTQVEINQARKNDFVKLLSKIAPKGCDLKIGDLVHWTNDYGVEWDHKILGFQYGDEYGDKYHKHVILDKESYWFPHSHGEFTKVEDAPNKNLTASNSSCAKQ